jgi:hypothetical protein
MKCAANKRINLTGGSKLMSDEELEINDEYRKKSEFLLQRIKDREEMVELLKIAHPSKIADIRNCIARLDDIIERTEKSMEMHLEALRLEQEIDKDYEELEEMTDHILPELLAYLEKNNPEAYEKLKADLAAIDEQDEEDEETD